MSRQDMRNTIVQDTISLASAKAQIIEIGTTERVLPEAGIFDEPTRCYRANLEWTPYIMGMVHWLADVTAWRDAEDESYQGIREILRFMQGEDCMSLQLRQKPDDACVLQQSLDDGATWQDVFDFSLCVTIQDKSYQVSIQNQVTNNAQTFIDIYNDYTTNYAGLPSDVHANLTQPSGDDSALRAALCNAIWETVRNACNSAVSYYTETINAQQQEANVLAAVAAFVFTAIALAAAVPTAGASLVALAGVVALPAAAVGLGVGLANYLVDFWQNHTIDQFQDEPAMVDVCCYLFDCLDGADVSYDDFKSCLDGTITGTNQQVILDFIEIMFETDATYAAFLAKWSNNKQYADAGIELFCPCVTGYQVWVWDFANGHGDFEIADFFGGGNVGTFANGRVEGTGTDTSKTLSIAYNNFEPTWRVHAVKLHLERVNGNTAQGNNDSAVQLRPTPNSQTGNTQIIGGQNQIDGEFVLCNNIVASPFYDDGTNQLYIFSRITKTGANPPVQVYLHKIEIQFMEGYSRGGYITDDDNICT